ncbi:hypothetical protein ABZ567_08765 [Streptomyces sp. NPDC016459]|uniref:hypothetical protein n=1 Tax=Streptomyces sp. NPDC016459 TaxID=3157190 RepID=UPI0033E066F4
MPSSARYAAFVRVQLRPVLALFVPAAAALAFVLSAQSAPGAAGVTAEDVTAPTARPADSGDGFSWG